jgi:acetyl-CoA carboxylase carboxyl transferase subunit beta
MMRKMEHFLDDRKSKIEDFKRIFRNKKSSHNKVDIPDGLFVKCEACSELIFKEDLMKQMNVCPKCQTHHKIDAAERLRQTCDAYSFKELYPELSTKNVLDFPGYHDKLTKYQEQTGLKEAFVCGEAKINTIDVAIGVLDSHFMMGSMGSVVGEKVTRLIEYSIEKKLPLIIFSASGGARMQEGIFSLMQMAKTSAALKFHDEAGLLFISVLTHPTTGGVAASFSSLGDINLAERGALIGFAGSRVIKQTINQELPEGFQTAEFQLNHGFVDAVVNRKDLRSTLTQLLRLHERGACDGE